MWQTWAEKPSLLASPVPPPAPSLWGPGAHGCCGTWLWYTGLVPKQVQLSGCGVHAALWHVLQDLAEQNSSYRKEGTGRSEEDGTHLTGSEAWKEHMQTGRYTPGNAWCQGRLNVMSLQIPLPEKTRLLFSIRRSIIRQGKNRAQGSALQSWAVFGRDALLAVSWWLWNTSLGQQEGGMKAQLVESQLLHVLFQWALLDALWCTERTCTVTPKSSRRDPWFQTRSQPRSEPKKDINPEAEVGGKELGKKELSPHLLPPSVKCSKQNKENYIDLRLFSALGVLTGLGLKSQTNKNYLGRNGKAA